MKSDNSAAAGARRARASARFKWLAAVNGSLDLSSVQRAVAISIGLHFNITDGRCDPGYEAIAGGTPYKRRAVITAVSDLAAKGWIVITPSRGRHRNSLELTTPSNSAHMHAPLADNTNGAYHEHQPCMPAKANGARQIGHIHEIASKKNCNREENMKENREEKRDNPYNPQQMENVQVSELRQFAQLDLCISQEAQRPNHPPSINALAPEDKFEQFWQIYPRKVSKAAARKAWPKAISKAPPEKIITAVSRYAVGEIARMKAGNNPSLQYTAHPATWLNAERWEDETTPTDSAPKTSPHGGRAIADLVAGSLGVLRKVE
jgi:hypothetical protein